MDSAKDKAKEIVKHIDGGIVFYDAKMISSVKDFEDSMFRVRDLLGALKGEGKILVNMASNPVLKTAEFRKHAAKAIKEVVGTIGYSKAAIYAHTITYRTIASFIMVASRTKGWKIFKTKKEALRWLKEP